MNAAAFWRSFARNKAALIGGVIFVAVALVALAGPYIYTRDPWEMAGSPAMWPGDDPDFPLGTDALGRDVLSGIIHGARVTLLIGTASMVAAMLLGACIGAVAGYFRGKTDLACMKLAELFQTTPLFIFVLTVVAIAGPSFDAIVVAIAVSAWPTIARLVRAEFLTLREREFVQYCIGLGMSEARIIFTQIMPNAIASAIIYSSFIFSTAVLTEAALSFLGLSDANVMSWGMMIGNGRESLRTAWFLSALPGLAIMLTVLAVNLMGEGINDALNPRSRQR